MGFSWGFVNLDDTLEPYEHHEALVTSMAAVGWSLNPSSVSFDEINQIGSILGFKKLPAVLKPMPCIYILY